MSRLKALVSSLQLLFRGKVHPCGDLQCGSPEKSLGEYSKSNSKEFKKIPQKSQT
jgi:hypothetical protein